MAAIRLTEDDQYIAGGKINNRGAKAKQLFDGGQWTSDNNHLPYFAQWICAAQGTLQDEIYLIGGLFNNKKFAKWNRVCLI